VARIQHLSTDRPVTILRRWPGAAKLGPAPARRCCRFDARAAAPGVRGRRDRRLYVARRCLTSGGKFGRAHGRNIRRGAVGKKAPAPSPKQWPRHGVLSPGPHPVRKLQRGGPGRQRSSAQLSKQEILDSNTSTLCISGLRRLRRPPYAPDLLLQAATSSPCGAA